MRTPEFTESTLKSALHDLDFTQLVMFMESLTEEIQVFAKRDNSDEEWRDAQAMKLAEEVGEFAGAYNRWRGWARRDGSMADVLEELSDVIISAFAMFAIMDFDAQVYIKDKLTKVITRGYVNPSE